MTPTPSPEMNEDHMVSTEVEHSLASGSVETSTPSPAGAVELLPCPHCGSDDLLACLNAVDCQNCGAGVCLDYDPGTDGAEAIAAWNRRAPSPQDDQTVSQSQPCDAGPQQPRADFDAEPSGAGSGDDGDEAFEQLMGDLSTLYGMKAGYTLSQDDVDALNRVDQHYRDEEEHVTDAYHRGWQDGLKHAGGADFQDLQNKLDEARFSLTTERALRKFDAYREFRWGAQECREMLARFVEQGGDATTAASIRANWNPEWGDDPGPPVEDRDTPNNARAALSTGGAE